MKLTQRIGYYLGGFSIGLVILAFFLNGKKVSCDYGPEARVLKNINSKTLHINSEAKSVFKNNAIDSLTLQHIMQFGTIEFSKSDTRKEPCGMYYLNGKKAEKTIGLLIENCDSIATIKKVILE